MGVIVLTPPDFLNTAKAALRTDIGFAQILNSVDNRDTNSESNTVVVRFAYSSWSRHVMPLEHILGGVFYP